MLHNKTPHTEVKHDTLISAGTLKLALDALRRAGDSEVADELEKSAVTLSSLPVDEMHYYKELASLTLSNERLEARYKMANKMSISYMKEFEKRGLVYSPLLPVEIDSF